MTTVLVVEDDDAIARLLNLQLSTEGYTVRSASDGTAALKAIAADPPDVLLLDVMMPDMDGWSVLRQVRRDEATAHLRVVMLTSRVMPADEIRGRNLGADAYMTKPYQLDTLLETLRQVLATREHS